MFDRRYNGVTERNMAVTVRFLLVVGIGGMLAL